jgi:short-subunit dehydrogenase
VAEPAADNAKAALFPTVAMFPYDLGCHWDTAALEARISHVGPVDLLINNAGMQLIGDFLTISPAMHQRAVTLNYETPLRLMRLTMPTMLARGRGHIVNISSFLGVMPVKSMFSYCSTKAALAVASEIIGYETPSTVRVLTVYPGSVATKMGTDSKNTYDRASIRLSPECTPESLARQIARAIVKGKRRLIFPRFYKPFWYALNAMTLASLRFSAKPRRQQALSELGTGSNEGGLRTS